MIAGPSKTRKSCTNGFTQNETTLFLNRKFGYKRKPSKNAIPQSWLINLEYHQVAHPASETAVRTSFLK